MISVKAIKYNTFKNTDFDLIVDAAFDSDNGESDSFLDRESVLSATYNGKLRHVHNYKFTNVFSPTFTFIKKDFSDVTVKEQKRIFAWLTSKSTPSFLTAYEDDSKTIAFECLGAFTDVKPYKLANNRTVGFTAVFESTMPWALSPIREYNYPEDMEITIGSDDLDSPIYPKLTIAQSSATSVVELDHALTDTDKWLPNTIYHYGTKYYWLDSNGEKHESEKNESGIDTTSVVITNTIYENGMLKTYKTQVINNIVGETVVLDGQNKIVSSSRTSGRIFGDDFDWSWLPLFNGLNTISVIGNCTIKIEFREPIKIVP